MDKYQVRVHVHPPQIFTQPDQHYATFIFLNALGLSMRRYIKFFDLLTQQGHTIITADYPCCGENQPNVSRQVDYNYQDLLDDFIPNLLAYVPNKTNHSTYLMGHDLGGHLATFYSALHDIPMIGIATGNLHYKNWQGMKRLNMLKVMFLFQILVKIYGYLPGYKVGLGDRETKGLISNWCQMVFTGRYDFLNQAPINGKGKGLYLCLQGDTYAPYHTSEQLSKLCAEATLTPITLPSDLKGSPHNAWTQNPASIVDTIEAYLQKQA